MRQVVDREAPVEHQGANSRCRSMVRRDRGGQGAEVDPAPGRPGRDLDRSGGPMNTALAAEVADGWLPMGYGSDGWSIHGANLEQGWARRGGRPDRFEIMGNLTIEVTDDVQAAIDAKKPSPACMWGAWAARTTTSTVMRWLGAAGPRPQLGFKNSGSRAARRGDRRRPRRLHRCRCPLRSGVEDRPTLG